MEIAEILQVDDFSYFTALDETKTPSPHPEGGVPELMAHIRRVEETVRHNTEQLAAILAATESADALRELQGSVRQLEQLGQAAAKALAELAEARDAKDQPGRDG